MKELLDIATRHAFAEEAIGAIFVQGDGRAPPNSSWGAPLKAIGKGAKTSTKGNKRGPKWRPQRVAITTSCDEDDNNKEADDSGEELVAVVERDLKRHAQQPADHFKKLFEVTYPNNAYPIRHKLKECSMMRNYMTTGAFTKGKKLEGDLARMPVAPFPKEKAVMSIYGGPAPHESQRNLKVMCRGVNAISPTTLEYLRWSKSPITFDRTDHLDNIPNPRRFSLIVDPQVGMTRLTKALMDGGSGINLMSLVTPGF
jgi:hypothetical protein